MFKKQKVGISRKKAGRFNFRGWKRTTDIVRDAKIHQAWWNSWTFQWKKWLSGVVSSFFFRVFFDLFFLWGGGKFFFSPVYCVICWCSPRKHGGEGKKHIFLKYCLKWSKWRWFNHCSYRSIVPTFRDLTEHPKVLKFDARQPGLGILGGETTPSWSPGDCIHYIFPRWKTGFSPCFLF